MTLLLVGVLTWYAGPYVGEPLRCGGTYDTTHEWIAVDIDAMHGWQCGDLVRVSVDGSETILLYVRDSGPLDGYCVEVWEDCQPIIVDVPWHVYRWDGLSVAATVENVTAGLRQEMERYR